MYEVSSKSRNVELAECWGNIAPHRDMSPRSVADEGRLVADMIELARQFGRYGYRRIAVLAQRSRLVS